jgi:hypothetical protein
MNRGAAETSHRGSRRWRRSLPPARIGMGSRSAAAAISSGRGKPGRQTSPTFASVRSVKSRTATANGTSPTPVGGAPVPWSRSARPAALNRQPAARPGRPRPAGSGWLATAPPAEGKSAMPSCSQFTRITVESPHSGTRPSGSARALWRPSSATATVAVARRSSTSIVLGGAWRST